MKKRDAFLKISIRGYQTNLSGHIFRISQKNETGKEKVVFQGEGIEKVVVQLPYTWGYVDSINKIRRSTVNVVKVVGTRGNQKAISGGMGRVFRKKN